MKKLMRLGMNLIISTLILNSLCLNSFACSACRALPQGFTDEEVEIIGMIYPYWAPTEGPATITWMDKKTGHHYQDRLWGQRKTPQQYIVDRKAANRWPYETGMPEEGWENYFHYERHMEFTIVEE